jgi:hypothetical protein
MQTETGLDNVRARVGVGRHNPAMAGRVRSFSTEEIEVLRTIARRLRDEQKWSGKALGDAIGISQQNAGKFTAARSTAGMDRTTANRLAAVAGYRDVEHLLLDAGALAEMKQPPGGNAWRDRDVAVSMATKMGYPKVAIDAVVHRYREFEYAAKGLRWWNDMIVLESLARAAEPASTATAPPPVHTAVHALRRGPRRKKTAGT